MCRPLLRHLELGSTSLKVGNLHKLFLFFSAQEIYFSLPFIYLVNIYLYLYGLMDIYFNTLDYILILPYFIAQTVPI